MHVSTAHLRSLTMTRFYLWVYFLGSLPPEGARLYETSQNREGRLYEIQQLDCLDTEEPPISRGTPITFRKRLIETNIDRRLIERTIEVANETGGFGACPLRAALDSSPLWGASRVEDTYNLLGHALRKALGVIARKPRGELTKTARDIDALTVAGSSLKAALDRNWDDPAQCE